MSAAAVYVITNTVTGSQYVGRSYSVAYRFRQHQAQLRRGKHSNARLQSDWNTHGEAAFLFEGLEIMPQEFHPSELEQAEARWIAKLNPAYNRNRPVVIDIPMRAS